MIAHGRGLARRTGSEAAHGVAGLPGVRTFRARPFRVLVASTLLLLGVTLLGFALLRQASDPSGQFGIDFADYRAASQRVAAGVSPYAPEMLQGPIDAQGTDRYRYPPVLAQLLAPTAGLPLGLVEGGWLLLQLVAVAIAVWLAGSWGGAARSLERVLWSGVAVCWFLPVFDSLWKGNVSDILALLVLLTAAGGLSRGVVAGAAAASGAFLKAVPLTLIPAALVGGGRRAITLTVAFSAAVLAASVVVSPGAWRDYAVVLPNLIAGSSPIATNLAPWAIAAQLGAPEPVYALVRVLSIVLAVACLVLSVWPRPFGHVGHVGRVSRDGQLGRDGRDARLLAATVAMLLLPGALWFHYLAVLLPFAALGWMRASTRQRGTIVISCAAITLGVAWLPLAALGASVLVVSLLRSLSSARRPIAPPTAPASITAAATA